MGRTAETTSAGEVIGVVADPDFFRDTKGVEVPPQIVADALTSSDTVDDPSTLAAPIAKLLPGLKPDERVVVQSPKHPDYRVFVFVKAIGLAHPELHVVAVRRHSHEELSDHAFPIARGPAVAKPVAPPPPPPVTTPTPVDTKAKQLSEQDVRDALKSLDELKQKGLINDEEYATKRKQLLDRL